MVVHLRQNYEMAIVRMTPEGRTVKTFDTFRKSGQWLWSQRGELKQILRSYSRQVGADWVAVVVDGVPVLADVPRDDAGRVKQVVPAVEYR